MSDWESYWNKIERTGDGGQVFWDSASDQSFAADLERFIPFIDPSLPLLDLGCGNGRQTRFFARHFSQVIGADVSPSAIRLAKGETDPASNITYHVFDALDSSQAEALHATYGDLNIYIRGVLHMIKWHDRPAFIANLAVLLGERGALYQIELPSRSILRLRALPDEIFATIPKITRRVGFNNEEREIFYPSSQWEVLAEGADVHIPTIPLSGRQTEPVPANFLILKPRVTLPKSAARDS